MTDPRVVAMQVPITAHGGECRPMCATHQAIAQALADERRNGFYEALNKVTQDFAENMYEIGGDIGTNEVLAFLESRIVHYPEARASQDR